MEKVKDKVSEDSKQSSNSAVSNHVTINTAAQCPDLTTTSISSKDNSNSIMINACKTGNLSLIKSILSEEDSTHNFNASLQDEKTGLSPLMVASMHGHYEICQLLLQEGAPWNALCRNNKCAGDYAVENEHWDVVNLLVDEGTKAELILGASIRLAMNNNIKNEHNNLKTFTNYKNDSNCDDNEESKEKELIAESHQPCTKPDYLQRNVRYNNDKTLLLDDDNDAVMMEWERPLMDIHASTITNNGQPQQTVLNIGFGLGIIDNALQKYNPALHVIIEAHPLVYQQMKETGWDKKDNVRICFGKWQDELPKLIQEGIEFDGIFYDTYGEHFTDLEDFHVLMARILRKPNGIYSFFNGLAPDNLFFHGVACQCVKLQLAQMNLQSDFVQCQIQVADKEWEGIRRKYWFGRETYYLPIITWKNEETVKESLPTNGSIVVTEKESSQDQISIQVNDDNYKDLQILPKNKRAKGNENNNYGSTNN